MSLSTCGCKKIKPRIDALGDHVSTCTVHSGAKKSYDWTVQQLSDLFHTTHHNRVKTQLSLKEFIKMVWVEYGCPGHLKGSWDGLGTMDKTKVTRDLTDINVQTPSVRITCTLESFNTCTNFLHTVVVKTTHEHENQ